MEEPSTSSVTGKKLFVLWLIFFLYLLFGGFIFHLLEKDNENHQREIARDRKKIFMSNYTCLDARALEDLISTLLDIQAQGVDPRGNATGPSRWDFTSSLFFSGTVVTTIGYGYIAPSSRSGQQFCICYALVGIPLCGFVLAALGERVKNQSLKFKKQIVKVCKKRKYEKAELIYMAMICITGFFIFFIIPAAIFVYVENWSFHTSLYYTFITLSTIGFGDYVAGTNEEKTYNFFYRLMIYAWILFGLVYFILLLGHVADLLQSAGKNIKKKTSTIRERKRKSGEDVDEVKKGENGEYEQPNREMLTSKKDRQKVDDIDQEMISLERLDKNTVKTEADVNVATTDVQQPVDIDRQPASIYQPSDTDIEIVI